MRLIPVEYALNQMLAEDIYDIYGKILLKSGNRLKDSHLSRIQNNSIGSVYIIDDLSKGILTPMIPNELKHTLTQEVKALFDALKTQKKHTHSTLQTVKRFESVIGLLDDVAYELNGRPKPVIDFVDIKSRITYTYEHCVNVAILSYLLGKSVQIPSKQLQPLMEGALFHDIGMAFIDESIFSKDGKLDIAEFVKIKQHPVLAYEFLSKQTFTNSYHKVIALQHHERLDGSGYPHGATEEAINPLAQVVAITDVYDAMTSDRPYSRGVPAYSAIDYILGSAVGKMNFDYVKVFTSKIMPYPVGTLVTLTDRRIAVVTKVHSEMPRKPVVEIINPGTKKLTGDIFDLTKAYQMDIKGIVYDIDDFMKHHRKA